MVFYGSHWGMFCISGPYVYGWPLFSLIPTCMFIERVEGHLQVTTTTINRRMSPAWYCGCFAAFWTTPSLTWLVNSYSGTGYVQTVQFITVQVIQGAQTFMSFENYFYACIVWSRESLPFNTTVTLSWPASLYLDNLLSCICFSVLHDHTTWAVLMWEPSENSVCLYNILRVIRMSCGICFIPVPSQTKEQFLWVQYAKTERACQACVKSFWQMKYSQWPVIHLQPWSGVTNEM